MKEEKELVNAETLLDEIFESVEDSKGENYYARVFKSAYNKTRKGLVKLNKSRKQLTNEKVVELTRELLERVLEELN